MWHFSRSAHTHVHLNDIRSASVWVGYFISLTQLLISPLCPFEDNLFNEWMLCVFWGSSRLIFVFYFSVCFFFYLTHCSILSTPPPAAPLNVVVLEILYTHMSRPICLSVRLCFLCHLFVYLRWRLLLWKVLLLVNVFDVRVWNPFSYICFFVPTLAIITSTSLGPIFPHCYSLTNWKWALFSIYNEWKRTT